MAATYPPPSHHVDSCNELGSGHVSSSPPGGATATALTCCCGRRAMPQRHHPSALISCRMLPSQIDRASTRPSFLTAVRCVRRASACCCNPATALTVFRSPVSQIAVGAWPASSVWYGESVRAHGSSWTKRGPRSTMTAASGAVTLRCVCKDRTLGNCQERGMMACPARHFRPGWAGGWSRGLDHHVRRDIGPLRRNSSRPPDVHRVRVRLGDCGRSLRTLHV